jgi:cobalamin-dependent methionine synthase I
MWKHRNAEKKSKNERCVMAEYRKYSGGERPSRVRRETPKAQGMQRLSDYSTSDLIDTAHKYTEYKSFVMRQWHLCKTTSWETAGVYMNARTVEGLVCGKGGKSNNAISCI